MINQPRPQKIGPHPPPPYRAPPPLMHENGAGMVMTPPGVNPHHPYSKFNISEPNITPQRHTFNMENGPQVQSHLRHLLASQPKHSTLDNQGQNAMLQHLRNTLDNNGKSYVSPENLRDTANRMFSRNQTDRSSFGGINASFQQQMNMQRDDPQKRHSYSNQSFRKAMEQQKVPPRVPPKPGTASNSRSVSRELLLTDNDRLDAELKHIMKGQQRLSISGTGTTPPLPALSPMPLLDPNHHDSSSPDGRHVLKQRPDLIGEADHKAKNGLRRASKDENLHLMMNGMMNGINGGDHSLVHKNNGNRLNMTQGAIDIEKVMAAVTNTVEETSDDHEDDGEVTQVSTAIDIGDANQIRKQLDGLENMYGEVLKLLGLRKFGRPAINTPSEKPNGHLRRHKMYGSMSSLPSVSSIGSRHLYKGQKLKASGEGATAGPAHHGKRSSSGTRGERSQNKRFQRLESHVVTLARSVAHLSSEVRNQQIILQEVEALRLEVQQLKSVNVGNNPNKSFFHNPVSPAHANRVKKLTKFFGDEPPLLRLFLKNLGYEKYASVFEEAKIGMLELPYLSEDRLEKLGIPMGPRMRILQESRASLQSLAPLSLVNTTAATTGVPANDNNNYNVYIL